MSVSFERASFVTLIVTIILGFLAFTPQSILPLPAVKTLVIAAGVLISAILLIISRMRAQSVRIPYHPIVYAGGILVLAVLAASFLSPNIASSFIGKSFSVDTGAFIFTLFISAFLSFRMTQGRENRTFSIFMAILGSFSLIALYHIVRLFAGVGFLPFGTFTSAVYTTVGSWHDLGTFAGLSLIISLVTLEFLPITNRRAKAFFYAVFALAAIVLIVIDLQSVWMITAVTALAIAAYEYFLKRKKNPTRIPFFPIVVGVVAIILAWSPGPISSFINNRIIIPTNTSYSEVNLPWQMTMDIAEPTLKASPIFGAGPGRFVNQYLLYKPEIVNATQFWQSNFSNANGFILTTLVTEGVVGFALWIFFVAVLIRYGWSSLMRPSETSNATSSAPFSRYTVVASFFSAGFLWISIFSSMPSHAILFALFILSGIFAAHVVGAREKTINFSLGRTKIPMIILLCIAILVSIGMIVLYGKAVAAQAYFQYGVQSFNSNLTLSATARNIQTAIKLNQNDVYYQTIAQLDVYAVNQIVASATTTPGQDTIQTIGALLTDGITAARVAEKFDPTNAYNYLAEAQVSEVAAGLQVQGAYANATSSYQKALALDPLGPSIYLALAKLEFFEKNDLGAKNYINVALQLKPDYTDALFEAGVISYTDKDYTTAVAAFKQVASLDSSYSNIQSALNVSEAAASASTPASSTVKSTIKSNR
jgi:Flp pilus assembly protein TadD